MIKGFTKDPSCNIITVLISSHCLRAAAHRGRADGLLVHVHALLTLQTGGQLLVRAVGNLLDQLQTFLHLAERHNSNMSGRTHSFSLTGINMHAGTGSNLIKNYGLSGCHSRLSLQIPTVKTGSAQSIIPVWLKFLSSHY